MPLSDNMCNCVSAVQLDKKKLIYVVFQVIYTWNILSIHTNFCEQDVTQLPHIPRTAIF